jgi:hypothetical protein
MWTSDNRGRRLIRRSVALERMPIEHVALALVVAADGRCKGFIPWNKPAGLHRAVSRRRALMRRLTEREKHPTLQRYQRRVKSMIDWKVYPRRSKTSVPHCWTPSIANTKLRQRRASLRATSR